MVQCIRKLRSLARYTAFIVAVSVITLVASAAAGDSDSFGAYWHDGKAELDGYRLRVTRYGQVRSGHAVMVYVTEPFLRSKLIKADQPSKNKGDVFDVLKLNLIRDFQTGIYDYNTMASVFVRSEDFEPVKITFSSAEWCGHVYEELRFESDRIANRFHSYFEGESSSGSIKQSSGGITQEGLFIVLRGLRGPYLLPGQNRSVVFLPSSLYRRLTHRPLAWSRAQIQRLADHQTVTVPAGSFEAIVYIVVVADGREGRFYIDRDYPHRVVRWTWKTTLEGQNGSRASETDELGELTGTARLAYWELHDNGHERYLDLLGLTSAGSPTPVVP